MWKHDDEQHHYEGLIRQFNWNTANAAFVGLSCQFTPFLRQRRLIGKFAAEIAMYQSVMPRFVGNELLMPEPCKVWPKQFSGLLEICPNQRMQ